MSDQIVLITLNILIWAYFVVRFIRVIRRNKLGNRTGLLAWTIQFFCYVVCLLTIASVERKLDDLAGGLPIILYVRSSLVILTAYLFALAMHHAHPAQFRLNRGFLIGTPSVIVALIVFFVLAQYWPIGVDRQTVIVKALRDSLMAVWLTTFFIPASVAMWRQERHRLMKAHDLLMIVFFTTFLIYCWGTLLQGLSFVLVPAWVAYVTAALLPITYACLLLFFLMLLPFRSIRLFFYPGQFYLYLRLKRLRTIVVMRSTIHLFHHRIDTNLLYPEELEVAIYEILIDILDHYHGMRYSEEGFRLADRIDAVVKTTPRYADLVRALAVSR